MTKKCVHFALEGNTPIKPPYEPLVMRAVAAYGDNIRVSFFCQVKNENKRNFIEKCIKQKSHPV